MTVRDLSSWAEFDDEAKRLLAAWQGKPGTSSLLFRGQCDSRWQLKTTLERFAPESLKASTYYWTIYGAKYQIESLTARSWDIPTPPEYDEWLSKQDSFSLFGMPEESYPYMIHLRHHGFPSPLLDWSQSPYVAAFFAFNNAIESDQVSIYAYLEHAGKGKIGSSRTPSICGLGPSVRSHARHVLQQSEYTICVKRANDHLVYACHEDVFANGDDEQDILWKFNIPAAERLKVLRMLDRYNLNAFSLFGSEESLMATVALRSFHFTHR